MAIKEKGTLGAVGCGDASKATTDDGFCLELVPDYADDTCLAIQLDGVHLPAALLKGKEVPVRRVKQYRRLRPTDEQNGLGIARTTREALTDTLTVSRTHNRTIVLELLRQNKTLFQCEMDMEAFALVMTGMTVKVTFTVTRHIDITPE